MSPNKYFWSVLKTNDFKKKLRERIYIFNYILYLDYTLQLVISGYYPRL